jgi:hypothetical protein
MPPWVQQVQKLPPGMLTQRRGPAWASSGPARVAGSPVVRGAISRLQQGGTLGGSHSGAAPVRRHGIHIDPVRRP